MHAVIQHRTAVIVWIVFSVCYAVLYDATGGRDGLERKEFTRLSGLLRALYPVLVWVLFSYVKMRHETLHRLRITVVSVQLVIELVLAVGSAWLFWVQAVIVRVAFTKYTSYQVLFGNYVLHYLPLSVLVVLVILCSSGVYPRTTMLLFRFGLALIVGSIVTIVLCIYMTAFSVNDVYGTMESMDRWLPVLWFGVCGLSYSVVDVLHRFL